MSNEFLERMKRFDTIAYRISKNEIDITYVSRFKFEERAYILQLAGLYSLMGTHKADDSFLEKCKELKEDFRRQYKKMHTDLYFCRKDYEWWLKSTRDLERERTRLTKQINARSPEVLNTALHIIDLYSRENIYCRLWEIIHKEVLSKEEIEEYINNCTTVPNKADRTAAFKTLQEFIDLITEERTVVLFRDD